MNFWKRQFPTIVVFVVGVIMVIQYYIPHPASEWVLGESSRWVRIIQSFALLLGVGSLVANHWRKIGRAQSGFGYSVVVLVSFAAMVFLGLATGIDAPREIRSTVVVPVEIARDGGRFATDAEVDKSFNVFLEPVIGKPPPDVPLRGVVEDGTDARPLSTETSVRFEETGTLILDVPEGAGEADLSVGLLLKQRMSPGYWMFETLKVSMEATMFSLLAFFISSAAFRAFRARSLDATIMLIAAVIMMIGRVSFGDMISMWFSETWLFFPKATDWLLAVPAMAAKRAILLGIALSVIALSIRIIFGLERSYLGRGD